MKRAVNALLSRSTGYQLTRVRPTDRGPRNRENRLVKQPTFILSSVRSGSTLLRVVLNSHSQICAPHELHLSFLRVTVKPDFAKVAMKELSLDERRLEHLLWDRVLERELTASGKSIIVDKTPNSVFNWERLHEAWPQARFIFLLRHPAAMADSLVRARKNGDIAEAVIRVKEYGDALEAARTNLSGLTVKYEELISDPERVSAGICEFLGVPWEPSMLDYGAHDHGKLVKFIGDWSPKIRSGEIHNDIVLPTDDEVPASLRDVSRAWGYLT